MFIFSSQHSLSDSFYKSSRNSLHAKGNYIYKYAHSFEYRSIDTYVDSGDRALGIFFQVVITNTLGGRS